MDEETSKSDLRDARLNRRLGSIRGLCERIQVTGGPVLILQDTTEFSFKRTAPERIGFAKISDGLKAKVSVSPVGEGSGPPFAAVRTHACPARTIGGSRLRARLCGGVEKESGHPCGPRPHAGDAALYEGGRK